jgi:hypothetical protein
MRLDGQYSELLVPKNKYRENDDTISYPRTTTCLFSVTSVVAIGSPSKSREIRIQCDLGVKYGAEDMREIFSFTFINGALLVIWFKVRELMREAVAASLGELVTPH